MENEIYQARRKINALNKSSAENVTHNKTNEEISYLIENTAKTMFCIAEKINCSDDILFHIAKIIKLIKK